MKEADRVGSFFRRRAGISIVVVLVGLMASCNNKVPQTPVAVSGSVFETEPLANADVRLIDAAGHHWQARTNDRGEYHLEAITIQPPLIISASAQGDGKSCISSATLRPICLAAVLARINVEKGHGTTPSITANINPMTDLVVSDVAQALGYKGPQQLVDAARPKVITQALINKGNADLHAAFGEALSQSGVSQPDTFDPVLWSIHPGDGMARIFSLLHHNRSYDNDTGEAGSTILTDIGFRPIVGLNSYGPPEPFNLADARAEWKAIKQAGTRIIILGDSTSSIYEHYRFPRMGWGQAFSGQVKDPETVVIDASRAGRSSRDYYNARWFAQVAPMIHSGDYVLINFGHNDQHCDLAKPARGESDVRNVCTYPNDRQGNKQFPAGRPEMSFQSAIERYIDVVRKKGARPVLFTPTARVLDAQGEESTPVVHRHFTRAEKGKDYDFTGDYSQTIRDAARTSHVPLIDLEKASMMFVNNVGTPGWKNYWLAADPGKYPFYAFSVRGSLQNPDPTHFQKKGAEAIAGLVTQEIERNTSLKDLAGKLR